MTWLSLELPVPLPFDLLLDEDFLLAVFFELSEDQARLRPVTPGYVVQSKIFTKALADIANGADVTDTLDAAVDEIDGDIEANQGYGHN